MIKKLISFATISALSAAMLNAGDIETSTHFLSGQCVQDGVKWEFFCSAGQNSGTWATITVPSCWETQGFGVWEYGIGKADEKGLYRHSFKTPDDFDPSGCAKLVFEAVATDAEVILNGKRLGLHQGGFYPFSFDVTDILKTDGGDNLLEVNVCKLSANKSVNQSERKGDYWNYGGIFRSVHLDIKPALHIERMAIDARADGQMRIDYFLGIPRSGLDGSTARLQDGYSLTADIYDCADSKKIASKTVTASSDGKGQLLFDAGEPKTWSDEDPNLYRIDLTLSAPNGSHVHVIHDKFGFRTFELREGDGLYLNGTRIVIKGINHHTINAHTGRTLSREDCIEDARLIKEMNLNAARLSHYPQDRWFYEACDSLGIFVLDELAGWHGAYDTPTGAALIEAMVCRDVNHPCVIAWDNGNETGWNTELDDEFAKWDPQNRQVIHPLDNFRGIEAMHYRSYGETQEYLRKPQVYMPTEILHGQFDGGLGAGIDDYWKLLRTHERFGGFFLWDMIDQGVVRLDKGGIIDTNGARGTDGIMGPQREKEGSFFTVREVLCPVQVLDKKIGSNFKGDFQISNEYHSTNINECRFAWEQVAFHSWDEPGNSPIVLKRGELRGCDIAPGEQGVLKTRMGRLDRRAQALYLTVYDKHDKELWKWNWPVGSVIVSSEAKGTQPLVEESDSCLNVTAGGRCFHFSKTSGLLTGVSVDGRDISLSNGPVFTAARRADRSLDRFYDHDVMIYQKYEAKRDERKYKEFHDQGVLDTFGWEATGDGSIKVSASFRYATMRNIAWTVNPAGTLRLDYSYMFEGFVDLMGVKFDYPEDKVLSKRWLGGGPYRIWKNRTRGTTYGLWENDYNDLTPTLTFDYPEFKGYFGRVSWMDLCTSEGHIIMVTPDGMSKGVGIYEPKDGPDRPPLFVLPKTGISFMDVVPAVRNKVNSTDLNGPSAQGVQAEGINSGVVYFIFK